MPSGTSSSEPLRRPEPGRPATPADLLRAQHREAFLHSELERVRSAAVAWRNGLGALLAGLVGFGLVKGRTDISGLVPSAAVTVGVLLLIALLVGAVGGWLLLRAAHGRPAVVAVGNLPPAPVLAHQEAISAARFLRRGSTATLLCATLLVSAVGLTWYGPPRTSPMQQVDLSDGSSLCGTVVRVAAGSLVLRTPSGERTIALDDAVGLRPIPSCRPPGDR